MKTIIAGGREFSDYELLYGRMQEIPWPISEVVSGTARGADKLGERWAKECDKPIQQFPADWDNYGKAAGHFRNTHMANYADALVAFWDGESKGTKHMIETAAKAGLYVKVFIYG